MSGLLHSCTPTLLQMNAIMEKKEYIKPSAEVIEMEPTSMMASSKPEIGVGDGEVDAGQGWSNRRRGRWGNLWADDRK